MGGAPLSRYVGEWRVQRKEIIRRRLAPDRRAVRGRRRRVLAGVGSVASVRAEMWLDDFEVGQVFESPSVLVDEATMIEFARRYDPQPFHVDPAAAAESVFGGLVASGWHTTALTMRLLVDHGPRPVGGLVGLAVDELRWEALRPGSRIRIRAEVTEVRRSTRTPARGTVRLRLLTLDQEDRQVQHAAPLILVPARPDARS